MNNKNIYFGMMKILTGRLIFLKNKTFFFKFSLWHDFNGNAYDSCFLLLHFSKLQIICHRRLGELILDFLPEEVSWIFL